jgi:hypothetical protein
MPVILGGNGVVPSEQQYGQIALQAGQAWLAPAGRWYKASGRYINWQEWDPISQFWRAIGGGSAEAPPQRVVSDGNNYRLVNQTGCAVGALLTNAGSGYTSAPTVTPSAGGSLWRAIVGSVVSTTVAITNGGTNYTYPPMVIFSQPPAGGIQATGFCTLSGGSVASVTVVDQGAGYMMPPLITFVNDPREAVNNIGQGFNAAAIASLTGSGTINALICIDHGTPLTAVPTLTFSGGGGSAAAATALMCWSITAYAAGTAGVGLAGTVARITAEDAFPTTAAAYLNPTTQSNLVKVRSADIKAPISAGGITATGAVFYDGGIYTSVPTPLVIPSASVVTTAPVVTFTMGGVNDVCSLFGT